MPTPCVSRVVPGLAALCAWLGLPGLSQAHFVLQSPPSMTEQNALGNPQKAPPCGDDGTAVATGIVSQYQAGDTITIEIEETIYHPGHYRVALAINDPSELPDPPPVTPGTTPCGSAPIDPAPAFPVLADGMLEHADAFPMPQQSFDVTLPDDIECDSCTLQVIQFMSNHALNDPGGCYYHHCATIAISADPVETTGPGDDSTSGDGATTGDSADGATTADPADGTASNGGTSNGDATAGATATASATASTGAGADTDTGQTSMDSEGGCGCSAQRGPGTAGVLLGLLGLVGLRTRRRRAAEPA